MLGIVLGIFSLIIVLITWSLCKVASDADDAMGADDEGWFV